MTALDVLRKALQVSDRATFQLIEDMRNAPLTQPTSSGGNHPLWILGHLATVESRIPQILFGEPDPLEHWTPLFSADSTPQTDASVYPSFGEILNGYRKARARNLEILDQLGDAGLNQPVKYPPPGLEAIIRTAGDAFLIVALHQMNHRGQVADARRAVGRTPLFTPGRKPAEAATSN